MTSDENPFIRDIRKAVREEVRGEMAQYAPQQYPLPPPSALAEERKLACCLVSGEVPIAALRPLVPRDFIVPLHEGIAKSCDMLRQLQRRVTVPFVLLCLEEQGFRRSPSLLESLMVMAAEGSIGVNVTECREAVLEASRARRILDAMSRLDLELRLGKLTASEATARLRAFPLELAQEPAAAPVVDLADDLAGFFGCK